MAPVDADGNGIPNECESSVPAAPNAVAEGSRYIAITPAADVDPIGLVVTGDPIDPDTGCVSVYVQTDGTLGEQPVYRLPREWGTAHVYGTEVFPNTMYHVQAEKAGTLFRSPSSTTVTWHWGDADHNGIVNLADVQLIVLGFQGIFDGTTLENLDMAPCMPNGVVNLEDAQRGVQGFQGVGYPCDSPGATGGF